MSSQPVSLVAFTTGGLDGEGVCVGTGLEPRVLEGRLGCNVGVDVEADGVEDFFVSTKVTLVAQSSSSSPSPQPSD